MPHPSFADFILDNGIFGFFEEPLTLKSGRLSHFYVNWRQATEDAFLLDRLSDFIADFIVQQKLADTCLFGVPEGASKTAIVTAMKLARRSPDFRIGSHTIAMGRAKPKLHGAPRDRYYVGAPQGPTLVLEDTVTTGLSLEQTLDQLLASEVKVVGVLCLTDRCSRRDDGTSVREMLQQRYGSDFLYLTMSQAPDLLKLALRRHSPSQALLAALALELGTTTQQLLEG